MSRSIFIPIYSPFDIFLAHTKSHPTNNIFISDVVMIIMMNSTFRVCNVEEKKGCWYKHHWIFIPRHRKPFVLIWKPYSVSNKVVEAVWKNRIYSGRPESCSLVHFVIISDAWFSFLYKCWHEKRKHLFASSSGKTFDVHFSLQPFDARCFVMLLRPFTYITHQKALSWKTFS